MEKKRFVLAIIAMDSYMPISDLWILNIHEEEEKLIINEIKKFEEVKEKYNAVYPKLEFFEDIQDATFDDTINDFIDRRNNYERYMKYKSK